MTNVKEMTLKVTKSEIDIVTSLVLKELSYVLPFESKHELRVNNLKGILNKLLMAEENSE